MSPRSEGGSKVLALRDSRLVVGLVITNRDATYETNEIVRNSHLTQHRRHGARIFCGGPSPGPILGFGKTLQVGS
jgi:hypothetical protein